MPFTSLEQIKNEFLFHTNVPVCIRCGSYRVTKNYFCPSCITRFFTEHMDKERHTISANFNVMTLVPWTPFESDSLSEYVHLLKRSFSQKAWAALVQKTQSQFNIDPATLLVPIPGHSTSYHTTFLVRQLGLHYGTAVSVESLQISSRKTEALKKEGLQKERSQKENLRNEKPRNEKPQKEKSRQEREEICFDVSEEFTNALSQAKKILLVDDILTTGATLKAAHKAIMQALSSAYLSSAQSKQQEDKASPQPEIEGLAVFFRRRISQIR